MLSDFPYNDRLLLLKHIAVFYSNSLPDIKERIGILDLSNSKQRKCSVSQQIVPNRFSCNKMHLNKIEITNYSA